VLEQASISVSSQVLHYKFVFVRTGHDISSDPGAYRELSRLLITKTHAHARITLPLPRRTITSCCHIGSGTVAPYQKMDYITTWHLVTGPYFYSVATAIYSLDCHRGRNKKAHTGSYLSTSQTERMLYPCQVLDRSHATFLSMQSVAAAASVCTQIFFAASAETARCGTHASISGPDVTHRSISRTCSRSRYADRLSPFAN